MKLRALPVLAALLGATTLLTACGGKEKEIIEGERVPVLVYDTGLRVDKAAQELIVRLPDPYINAAWPQAGGFPDHAMHHLAASEKLEVVWKKNIGAGSSSRTDLMDRLGLAERRRLITEPIVAAGNVFAMDAETVVTALSEADGERLWQADLKPEESEQKGGIFGGGVAFFQGRVYATTGYGEVYALNSETGETIWKSDVRKPLRGSPTVSDGQVYSVSYDNQLYAMSVESGEILWVHEGFLENAGLLGAGSPAVSGGLVLVPFSSGELYALRVENGRVAWSDTLMRTGLMTPMAALSDIDARPVVDGNRVYSVSNGGRMAAIDLRTGDRVWERNIASHQSPWLAGDFLFLITDANEVVCISKADGKIKWVTKLPRYADEERKEILQWSGPILVSDRLIITSSHGFAASVSPYTGKFLGRARLSGNVTLQPVVANNSLYFLTEDADLVAMR